MAFFTAIGTISNDIVRRETKNGVVAKFRLETGAPRGRKLWIDIECWGHLAGSVARHASSGRAVAVSGRLQSTAWRDRTTHSRRESLRVVALDVDLLERVDFEQPLVNRVTVEGGVRPPQRTFRSRRGHIHRFAVTSGQAQAKTGSLKLDVHTWTASDSPPPGVRQGSVVSLQGALFFDTTRRGLALWATELSVGRVHSDSSSAVTGGAYAGDDLDS